MTNRILTALSSDNFGALAELVKEGVQIGTIMDIANGNLDEMGKFKILALADHDDEAYAMSVHQKTREFYNAYLEFFPEGRHRADVIVKLADVDAKSSPVREANRRDYDKIAEHIKKYINSVHKIYADKEKTSVQHTNLIIDKTKEFLKQDGIRHDDLYQIIRGDKNLFMGQTIKKLIEEDIIDENGLETKSGIDKKYLEALRNDDDQTKNLFDKPEKLNAVKMESTEIYFWGLPSSGKSCIIGGVMSRLFKNPKCAVEPTTECNGYDYLNVMRTCFSEDGVVTLPPGTPLESCYEMGFVLRDTQRKSHPITIIDMAGELLLAMYTKMTKPQALTAAQTEALETAEQLLNSNKNHKIHFFVVEYGAEKLKYNGRDHMTYLLGAMQYIRKLNVFNKKTDAIYVLVSKTDCAPFVNAPDKYEQMQKYFADPEKGIGSFCTTIDAICHDKHIEKKGRLAFTLGDVCFQNYCTVDPAPSQKILEKMVEATNTRLPDWFTRIFG